MNSLIDFSNCKKGLRGYGGADNKISLLYKGNYYMVKFPNRDPIVNNGLESSYRNNIVSEHLSCKIIESVGLQVQKTILGTYGKKEVVACEDFTSDGFRLMEFSKFENSFHEDFDSVKNPSKTGDIEQILKILNQDSRLAAEKNIQSSFWDMFIMDAFLGNFDRHTTNWGVLVNEQTEQVKFAPIYDCGGCLYPKLGDHGIQNILSDESQINRRIYDFPKSAMTKNGEKITYHTFLQEMEYEGCREALLRVVPNINLNKIQKIIYEVPAITQERREFYKVLIDQRYQKIIKPVFEQAKKLQLENIKYKAMNHMKTSRFYGLEQELER